MSECNCEQQWKPNLVSCSSVCWSKGIDKHKEKDPRIVCKGINASTKYSFRVGNVYSLEVCIPSNLANLAARRSLSQCETQHLARCNAGVAWRQPGYWLLRVALPRRGTGPSTAQRHFGFGQGRYWVFSPPKVGALYLFSVNLWPYTPQKEKSLNQLVLIWGLPNAKKQGM